MTTDDHGQPLNRKYNWRRLEDRAVDELIGLVKGIVADNDVNRNEAAFLFSWLTRNKDYCQDRVVNHLYYRVKEMLEDNILDRHEQLELLSLLKEFSGETCDADIREATSATFPLNKPAPPVNVEGYTFCFTGKFAYGPRRICEKAVTDLGGIAQSRVTNDLNYLVIGSLCSSDWIHTTYGRKIEKAMTLQEDRGCNSIFIIHEDHWADHLFK